VSVREPWLDTSSAVRPLLMAGDRAAPRGPRYIGAMRVRCELCDKLSSKRSIRCDCGYDFRTGEVTAAIEGAEREFEVARRRIRRGLVIGGLVIGGLGLVIGGFLSPFYEFAALIALASWLLGVAGAVGAALGSMPPSRQLRHAKARKQLPAARVVQ
jgi:hypothetical protein